MGRLLDERVPKDLPCYREDTHPSWMAVCETLPGRIQLANGAASGDLILDIFT